MWFHKQKIKPKYVYPTGNLLQDIAVRLNQFYWTFPQENAEGVYCIWHRVGVLFQGGQMGHPEWLSIEPKGRPGNEMINSLLKSTPIQFEVKLNNLKKLMWPTTTYIPTIRLQSKSFGKEHIMQILYSGRMVSMDIDKCDKQCILQSQRNIWISSIWYCMCAWSGIEHRQRCSMNFIIQ